MTLPVALTIAGSDSSAGAGIQADLKTFAALGVYGASAMTALTAQNTQGVSGIHLVPADFVIAQIDAVFSDLDVKAVKVGMVAQRATIDAIVKRGEVAFMVATDLAARGIDIADITHVINYTVPNAYEDYIHRIGRAGRAGRSGNALTFLSLYEARF